MFIFLPSAIIVFMPSFAASSPAMSFDDMPPLPCGDLLLWMQLCMFLSIVSMRFIVSFFSISL